MTTTKCDSPPVPFKIFHKIAEKLHALHIAHRTHSALADEEEKRKKIVRDAKEKNWPKLFPKKPEGGHPKPIARNTKPPEPTPAETQKKERHKLLLSHFARHLKKQKEAE